MPYLVVGLLWTVGHGDRFAGRGGVELAAAIVGAIVSWPVLIVPTMCPG